MSRCLLGERVRYDAKINEYPGLFSFIEQHFDTIAVCPEVEIGLSVPRPAVQLYDRANKISICGRDDLSVDITVPMGAYCDQRPAQLDSIHGYIFKSKSPSCGIKDIPVFNAQNEIIRYTNGVFVNAILQHYPELPITDEQGLNSLSQRKTFLQQVKQHQQNPSC